MNVNRDQHRPNMLWKRQADLNTICQCHNADRRESSATAPSCSYLKRRNGLRRLSLAKVGLLTWTCTEYNHMAHELWSIYLALPPQMSSDQLPQMGRFDFCPPQRAISPVLTTDPERVAVERSTPIACTGSRIGSQSAPNPCKVGCTAPHTLLEPPWYQ